MSLHKKVLLSKAKVKEFVKEKLPGFVIKEKENESYHMLSILYEALSCYREEKVEFYTIINKLRTELLLRYEEFYKQFNDENVNVLTELNSFLHDPLNYDDRKTSNLFLVAFGNAFQVNVIVYQSDEKFCWMCNLTNNDSVKSAIYFARTLSTRVYPIIPQTNVDINEGEHTLNRNYSNDDDNDAEIVFVNFEEDHSNGTYASRLNGLNYSSDRVLNNTSTTTSPAVSNTQEKNQRKFKDRNIWDKVEYEIVEKVPVDINGLRVYEIHATSRDDLLQRCRDGRRWKKDSRSRWSGYKSVRYKDCNGSLCCTNLNCTFFVEFHEVNNIKFDRKKLCTYCGTLGKLIECPARRYTAFKSNNLARIFHYGEHTCQLKVELAPGFGVKSTSMTSVTSQNEKNSIVSTAGQKRKPLNHDLLIEKVAKEDLLEQLDTRKCT